MESRLGFNSTEEIFSHPFFQEIDFIKLMKRKYIAPFIPSKNKSLKKAVPYANDLDTEKAHKKIDKFTYSIGETG